SGAESASSIIMPAIALGATIDLMGATVRAGAAIRIDQIEVGGEQLRVKLRINDVTMKVLGESMSPVAGLLRSGALDLSKPGNLVKFMPKKPDVLVEAHDDAKRAQRAREAAMRAAARDDLVRRLAGERLSEAAWKAMLEHARAAAERGEKDFLLIRFPSALCADAGRMINAPDPNWPSSLRGPAADVYERWRDELKPAGFGLSARILEFPGGFPGDAGLTLTWGG
ncbi:MAG: hypothetical protein ABTQ29_14685, partial [Siculibacillus sp.]